MGIRKILCLFIAVNFLMCSYSYAYNPLEPAPGDEVVSLDYKDASLSSVLRSLSYSYGLNLVAAKDITGKVTVTLQNVTLDEALHAILDVNGYTFTRKGKLIYVTPGPGIEGIGIVTETVPLKYLTAAEASALLQKTISSKGDIRVNESTNSLVITDFTDSITKVREVLKEVDSPPIQVLIEAKLADITEKDLQNFGFSYTATHTAIGDDKGLFGRSSAAAESIAGSQTLTGPSSSLSGGQLKITSLALKGLSATVTLDALIQDNKAHLLASPSITTLNGKEARIIIGERFPYKEKTQTTTGTIESTKFVEIGTTLRVTPRVSPDGWITMAVHPEVSSLTSSLDAGPRVATREADATIRVKDGETIIIGGLIKRQDDRVKGKVPILGYIPIIGWLFSNASVDSTSTELVVFITPHIIRSPEEAEKIAKLSRREEVSVSISGVGERVMVDKLWDEGINLQKDRGIESVRKDLDVRIGDALEHYRQIASQFPGSDRADDALYRAGVIAYDYFYDLELARRIFTQLVEGYPDSPYVGKSKRMIEHIDKRLGVKEKRKNRNIKTGSPSPVPEPRADKSEDKQVTGNRGVILGK